MHDLRFFFTESCCLAEVPIGEDGGRDKTPRVEAHAEPRRSHLDPHRRHILLRQLGAWAGNEKETSF